MRRRGAGEFLGLPVPVSITGDLCGCVVRNEPGSSGSCMFVAREIPCKGLGRNYNRHTLSGVLGRYGGKFRVAEEAFTSHLLGDGAGASAVTGLLKRDSDKAILGCLSASRGVVQRYTLSLGNVRIGNKLLL